jgi:hypothetical protein
MREQPPAPDFGGLPKAVLNDLDTRFPRIPFERVRRMADYWALRDVETDHVRLLTLRNGLSPDDRLSVESWWLDHISRQLADTIDRLTGENRVKSIRLARNRPRWLRGTTLSQIWFNTFGPGGRCWFGNRYTTIRHFTFRLHWRP